MRLIQRRSINTRGRPRRRLVAALGGAALAAALVALPVTSNGAQTSPSAAESPASSAPESTPHHLVFIVLDQLRPEFIDAFDMQNVKALMKDGTSFPKAYLGHMASETVISHNVMTSGILPKHMGWSDEWFRDVDGVLGPTGNTYVSGSLAAAQFDLLINQGGYQKLPDYLHQKFPGTIVAAVGQKSYATNSMGGPGADIRVTMGSRNKDCDVDGSTATNWRGPAGTNVPAYITGTYVPNTECSRFYINSNKNLNNHGTLNTSPAWMYPLEGNRDVPGNDPDHYGGDVWTADAAMAMMDNENWSGMLITMGGIDKVGHMWGGLNDVPPYPGGDAMTHMAAQAKTADDQVGRIMDKLDQLGIRDDTLVVLTADHGQLTADNYFGIDGQERGNFNWYYGTATGTGENYLSPQPEIQKLIDGTGNVQMSMQDSAIRTWLVDRSLTKKQQAADVMATLGGVRASYYLDGNRYKLRWEAPRSAWGNDAWQWYKQHGQEIVDTAAAPYGPDVIGLLANNTSYGVKGDHGGAQESVQRIPIIFAGPGVQAGRAPAIQLRSVDITPTILRELGITPSRQLDGKDYPLP